MVMGYKAWTAQQHLLNRMGFKELNRAYITYPGVQIYLTLMIGALIGAAVFGGAPL